MNWRPPLHFHFPQPNAHSKLKFATSTTSIELSSANSKKDLNFITPQTVHNATYLRGSMAAILSILLAQVQFHYTFLSSTIPPSSINLIVKNQNHSNTMKEKELEKEKEKIMKLLGLSHSKMYLHERSPFEITPTLGSNLIPREINTNILVYAITIDVEIGVGRYQTNNFQYGISTNVIGDLELHTAARCGNTKGAQEAVGRNKGLLCHKDSQSDIPLHLAVENGHMELAFFLVKVHPQGSYALNHSKISPLYLAVYRKDLDLVKGMFCGLAKDDKALDNLKKGKSIVHVAITDNNQEMLQTILKYQRELIKCTNEDGLTPLSYAAFNGNLDIVRYLLKKFPKSISYLNNDKSNPFHKAGLGGHVEVLKELYTNSKTRGLLLAGDHLGRTVLHLAAKERGNKLRNVISYLLNLKEGKDLIKKKDENFRTPEDLAKTSLNNEVEELIKGIKP